MEMCYNGALVMPSNYTVVNSNEMEYIEGGISAWAKAGIIAAVIAGGVALTVALAYGQIWLAAKIMGLTVKSYVKAIGAKAVATIVAGAFGMSLGVVTSAVSATLKL